jgi:pimeloyl-ACP methyl ester carboxylesterase
MPMAQQEVGYFATSDGVRLAYSIMGKGTPVVRTPHWFAHLEHDLRGPVFRPQILGLAHRHELLRYDARGVGMSQRDGVEISFDRLVQDLLEAVDHVGFDRFALVG